MALLPETKYAYAVARTRALETGLLERSQVERLLTAESLTEALRFLGETVYGETVGDLAAPEAYEAALEAELRRAYQTVGEMMPDQDLLSSLRWRYDFLNLKILLRARLATGVAMPGAGEQGLAAGAAWGEETRGISPETVELLSELGTLSPEEMLAAAREEWAGLPPSWQEVALAAQAAYAETRDPQTIDLLLDRTLYQEGLALARQRKVDFLAGWWQTQIDLINIRTFLRFQAWKGAGGGGQERKDVGTGRVAGGSTRSGLGEAAGGGFLAAVLPGGRLDEDFWRELATEDVAALVTRLAFSPYAGIVAAGVQAWQERGSLAEWERLSDDYLTGYLRQAKYIAFGPEPLLAYLLAREQEVKLLRLILAGKQSGVAPEAIRERLRELYG